MTESPEIKTYTPTEAQHGGEGKEPAPTGIYVWESGEIATMAILNRSGGAVQVLGFGWPEDGFLGPEWNASDTFTGPISPDEIIPAAQEYRKLRAVRDLSVHPSQVQIEKALKAQAAFTELLKELQRSRAVEEKAAELYGDDPQLPAIEWMSGAFLQGALSRLRADEEVLLKKGSEPSKDG